MGLCVLTCAGLAQPVVATAAPSPTPSTHTSYSTSGTPFSVTISPARLTIPADDLDSTQHVTVVNRGTDPVTLDVQLRNFVAQPDGGLSYAPDAPYGAADWAHVSPTHLTLQSGESTLVDATFDVPAKREPGDHQLALIFLAPSGKTAGNIAVNRGIGAPVYLTVPGPVDDSVRLDSLRSSFWSFRGDPDLTLHLTSTGTVHRDFRGPTALPVGTSRHLGRFSDFTVSRGAERVVSTTWDAPLVCVCHPYVTVTNAGGVPQTVSTRVVVVPWWGLAGLGLIVILGLASVLRRRLRAALGTGGAGVPAVAGSG